jgi:hypothetical protein
MRKDDPGWIGEGEEGWKRLAQTKGTVWVVKFSLTKFGVFEIESDADRFFLDQLPDKADNEHLRQVVKYVNGKPEYPPTV